jgi:hypothetical protein
MSKKDLVAAWILKGAARPTTSCSAEASDAKTIAVEAVCK